MLDVNGSDTSVGMSCPPQPFVDSNFLQCIKDSLLNGGTVYIFFIYPQFFFIAKVKHCNWT